MFLSVWSLFTRLSDSAGSQRSQPEHHLKQSLQGRIYALFYFLAFTVTSFTVAHLKSELMLPHCCMRQKHPHRESQGFFFFFSKKASICTLVINDNPVSSLKYRSPPTLFIQYYEFHSTFHLSYEKMQLKNSLSTAIDFFSS